MRSNLREQAKQSRAVTKKNVDVIVEAKQPEQQPIQESASNLDETASDPMFNTYMGELGKY